MQAILIGFMGSGKSSTAQLLSEQTNLKTYDLDKVIEDTIKMPISKYFNQYGENQFRKLENENLNKVIHLDGVLSTGGGTPINAEGFKTIQKSHCPTFYLDASDAVIENRIQKDKVNDRPLVEELGYSGLIELKNQRHSIYNKLADYVIKVDNLNKQQVVEHIIKILNKK
ncbi:hypothetical protein FD06_GL000746 [Apilactobacillus ozensis DSM 23829 = JCM 17196]|uniref:Shikimate kinase n=1 Tax=Apilactobacillus ozensis DSM 23829 = JCM 17196 TaxID=1423781 RepID=A0A0R2ALK8_9LACO|nr:shikimate kinase [Apilactobacillus ozensis]KRM67594.1 hypothetical protein FD06_GL000746 [Apilactobacillus ozensis DSM 23829 = JCM 17196]